VLKLHNIEPDIFQDPVFEVKLDTSLLMTMGKLVATKAHRLWVTDESEAVIGLVSLTDILRAISKSTTNQ
jgi:CBS domain containing-hemolysin-like protein